MDRTAVGRLGFTLVEVLLAILLVSMVGIGLTQLTYLGHRSVARLGRTLWANQEPRRLLDWMGQDMALAETVNVYSGDWTTPVAVGTAGDRMEIQYRIDNDGTPDDRTNDKLYEIRYSWTTNDPSPPTPNPGGAGWDASMGSLIRRYERTTVLPAPPGNWETNGIVAGLGEDAAVGSPNPDTALIAITAFQVTQIADTTSSQLNPLPQNLLRVDLTAAGTIGRPVRSVFYVQSRSLRARRWLCRFLFAFLRRDLP